MREIKFRALYEGEWYYQTLEEIITITLGAFRLGKHKSQWTGLTDINNVEVYEGDYFDTEDGLMEVFFIDGKFILMWADNGTYRCDLCEAVKNLSRCGNKYENPEMKTQN